MKIKNIREPDKKEKQEIIPRLMAFGISTLLVAGVIYITSFNKEIGESLYIDLASHWYAAKEVINHNLLVKVFEFIYGRDYMLSRLEGLSVAGGLSVILNLCGAAAYELMSRGISPKVK